MLNVNESINARTCLSCKLWRRNMANNNKSLSAAGQAKKDEFYTQLVDIENELRHYKEHWKQK